MSIGIKLSNHKSNLTGLLEKRGLLILIFYIGGLNTYAQIKDVVISNTKPVPSIILDESTKRSTPSEIFIWDNNLMSGKDGSYSFSIRTKDAFTFFGIGLKCDQTEILPDDFTIRYRTRTDESVWTEWAEIRGDISPAENPFGMFRSDIIFVDDSVPHNQCQVVLMPPGKVIISYVKVDLVNIKSKFQEHQAGSEALRRESIQLAGCELPNIVPRSTWCGSNSECLSPTFTPTIIAPTHVIVHHGGSPNTYTDGQAIVLSYWNYHVFSNGWDDIGYNFLTDKYGNIFMGRHNPEFITKDVRGAHSGYSNSKSIGICFLGNSDVTNPTEIQLSKTEELLAWWFSTRELDPTTSENIINQEGTDQINLPRISGHKDVKPATDCPGNNLYNLLPSIRSETKIMIEECEGGELPDSSDNNEKLQIFPNPVTEGLIRVVIRNFEGGRVQIRLYSITGQRLYLRNTILEGDSFEIDNLMKYPAGVYILKVEAAGDLYSGKVIKQNAVIK